MSQGMGTLDFFLLEAGEYLERLDALAQPPAGSFPHADEFLRIARAFRGSAIMANQHGMARAAQGIESCARALREGRLTWSEAVRGELVRAVDDCKIVMRRLRTPEPGDNERAEAIGIRLDRMSGRASAAMRASQGPGLDAGGRAFVAREAAAIASVLQRAARTLRADPAGRDVCGQVAPAMSALRGVAVLNDLPPLGDILAAVDSAVKDVYATPGAVSADVPEVFDAAGRALARAAREVVDAGKPTADSEEARGFATRLFATLSGVVPVESLYFDDQGPHVVQPGTPPATGAGFARVELVSQGEYLEAASTELARAASPLQRDLRLFAIAAALRPMMGAGGAPLPAALSAFAVAARDAIGKGLASAAPDAFHARIHEAATALTGAQSGDESALAGRIAAVAAALAAIHLEPQAAAPPAPFAPEPARSAQAVPSVPSQPPAPSFPSAPSAAPAPRTTGPRMPSPVLGEADLATSYLTFEQLITERGIPLGTLDDLLAGGTVPGAAPPVPAPSRARAPSAALPAPVVPIEALAPQAGVVPVEELLYRGERALRRALELKADVLAAVKSGDPRLNALVSEVIDLLELGVGAGR